VILRSAASGDPFAELEGGLAAARCIVVVGLPGMGKSFWVRRMAMVAAASDRPVHVLQWDIARLAWDTPEILAQFPEVDGITHAAIRGALGIWVRGAVATWFGSHAARNDVLIVEAPVIGARFSELAKRADDVLEPHLADPQTLFVIVAPTIELQRDLRRRRAEEAAGHADALERHNASLGVLDVQLAAVEHVARRWGRPPSIPGVYDPELYVFVMRKVLRHRNVRVLRPDSLVQGCGSVYDLRPEVVRIGATADDVRASIAEAARDMDKLHREVEFGWALV
jgi:hypothetical protein